MIQAVLLCLRPGKSVWVVDKLHALAKNLRGQNRETLIGIIESLDDIAQCTFNAADYGRDELKKALEVFKSSK